MFASRFWLLLSAFAILKILEFFSFLFVAGTLACIRGNCHTESILHQVLADYRFFALYSFYLLASAAVFLIYFAFANRSKNLVVQYNWLFPFAYFLPFAILFLIAPSDFILIGVWLAMAGLNFVFARALPERFVQSR